MKFTIIIKYVGGVSPVEHNFEAKQLLINDKSIRAYNEEGTAFYADMSEVEDYDIQ